jgi:integrase
MSRRSVGSVTKKRALWYAIVNIPSDSPKKRLRQWSRGFKTRREAERELAQLLIEDRQLKATRADVEHVVSRYIREDLTIAGRRSPTTTQRYWGLLRNMAPLHHKIVDRIDASELETFYVTLLEDGLSHTTVHHVHNLMSAAFRWASAKRIGLVTRNPISYYDVKAPRRAKSGALSLTKEQAGRALESIIQSKHANAILFSLASGCRRGETCGLKWESVDLKDSLAIIRESRYQVKDDIGQKCVKEERIRQIPLNTTATRALLAEKRRQIDRRRFASDAWTETGFVFSDELGHPLSPMALTNAFYRIAKRAKLPTTRMHDLRHTTATFILSAGGNPVAASKILGHADEATTMRLYGHVIGLDERRAMRQVDRALGNR